ncbi:MAG: hypothetical protein CMN28_12545 [Salinisphaeraceae bacterium]|nr:hypothetical protein [Salinisphaeraceae bacterium]
MFDASSGQQRPRWLTDLLESGVARRVDWDYQPDPLDMAGVQSVTVIDDGGERAARAVNTAFLLKQQNRGLQVSVSRTSPATPAPGARVLPFPGGRHGL